MEGINKDRCSFSKLLSTRVCIHQRDGDGGPMVNHLFITLQEYSSFEARIHRRVPQVQNHFHALVESWVNPDLDGFVLLDFYISTLNTLLSSLSRSRKALTFSTDTPEQYASVKCLSCMPQCLQLVISAHVARLNQWDLYTLWFTIRQLIQWLSSTWGYQINCSP